MEIAGFGGITIYKGNWNMPESSGYSYYMQWTWRYQEKEADVDPAQVVVSRKT